MKTTNEELLQKVRERDEEAFRRLFHRLAGPLYRFLLQMGASRPLAEETVQDIFLMLIEKRDTFDENRGPLLPYLYGVARNKLRSSFRGRQRLVSDSVLEERADDGARLEERVAARLELGRLQQMIGGLPEQYREVLILCDLNEFSYHEAAQALDCNVGTVRSRLHRARGLLREKLSQTEEAGGLGHAATSIRSSL